MQEQEGFFVKFKLNPLCNTKDTGQQFSIWVHQSKGDIVSYVNNIAKKRQKHTGFAYQVTILNSYKMSYSDFVNRNSSTLI